MLYQSGEMSKPIRLQSPYISETEVKKVAEYLVKNSENDIPSDLNLDSTTLKLGLLIRPVMPSACKKLRTQVVLPAPSPPSSVIRIPADGSVLCAIVACTRVAVARAI